MKALGGFNSATRAIRDDFLSRAAQSTYPQSYQAYTQLRAVANQMVFPILASGALGVNPTDADVELARQAMFDISSASDSWIPQLNALIQRKGGTVDVSQPNPQSTGPAEGHEDKSPANGGTNASGDPAETGTTGVDHTNSLIAGRDGNADTGGMLEGTVENLTDKDGVVAPMATKIDKSMVPDDVIDFKPKKNRWIEGDDGAFYILYDAKLTDNVRAAWYRAVEIS